MVSKIIYALFTQVAHIYSRKINLDKKIETMYDLTNHRKQPLTFWLVTVSISVYTSQFNKLLLLLLLSEKQKCIQTPDILFKKLLFWLNIRL